MSQTEWERIGNDLKIVTTSEGVTMVTVLDLSVPRSEYVLRDMALGYPETLTNALRAWLEEQMGTLTPEKAVELAAHEAIGTPGAGELLEMYLHRGPK